MREYELVIVGGGAAGILCAIDAYQKGIKNILLIEKDPEVGGALNLGGYNISKNKYITGKEYKEILINTLDKCRIDIQLNTMVLKIGNDNEVLCTSPENGIEKIKGKYVILANGGKESSRKVLTMVGDRCSGIFTVGMAKKIFNMNLIPGKRVLIVGDSNLHMIEKDLKSHNIEIVGIMSENLHINTYELTNKVYQNYKVEAIYGEGRINRVKIAKDEDEEHISCDTLIFANPMLSDGVVAMRSNIKLNLYTTGAEVDENFMTSRKNIYACGNGVYPHEFIEDIEKECSKLINNLNI